MTAGRSGTPLAEKLGLKEGCTVALLGEPPGHRALLLPLGYVDIKVCAVDAVWSGLKLVVRKELRRP